MHWTDRKSEKIGRADSNTERSKESRLQAEHAANLELRKMLCLAKKRLEEQTPAEEEEEDRLLQAERDRNQKEIERQEVQKILGPSFQEKLK